MNENKAAVRFAIIVIIFGIVCILIDGPRVDEVPCNTWVDGHMTPCEPTPQYVPESCDQETGESLQQCVGDFYMNEQAEQDEKSALFSGK